MNDYLLSVLLGIVEGITEFLPVSSTAHLRIFEALLKIDLGNSYWKMFTIVIQLGAILALPIYFRSRILGFLMTFPSGERHDRTVVNHPVTITLIAFVCTGIPAFLLTKTIGKHLESLAIMGWALLIGGIIMWLVDAIYGSALHHRTENMEEMTLGQGVWIGLCQTLSAIFPGTSRSMSTITAGELAGMSRPAALEFSFFLSIPTMVAATAYDLLRTLHPKHIAGAEAIAPLQIDHHGWVLLGIGFVVSFIVALAVVAWFMRWVSGRGFAPFSIYRVILGIAVLVWAYMGH